MLNGLRPTSPGYARSVFWFWGCQGLSRHKRCPPQAGPPIYSTSLDMVTSGGVQMPKGRTYANFVYVLKSSARASATMSGVNGQASLSGACASLMKYKKR